MGLFDSVYFYCPECRGRLEIQSKAGACLLSSFSEDKVPLDISKDINGDWVFCETCNRSFQVGYGSASTAVPMRLR